MGKRRRVEFAINCDQLETLQSQMLHDVLFVAIRIYMLGMHMVCCH